MGLSQVGMIVLLVENDRQMRRAMSLLVESWGVNVIEAENAEIALDLLDDLEITPDALLFDYQLGTGMTGTQLYEVLRDRLGALPCTIVSAERSPDLRDICQALRIGLLLKPVDRHLLGAFLSGVADTMTAAR